LSYAAGMICFRQESLMDVRTKKYLPPFLLVINQLKLDESKGTLAG